MFPRRMFAARMFAPRYYPQSSGTGAPVLPPADFTGGQRRSFRGEGRVTIRGRQNRRFGGEG